MILSAPQMQALPAFFTDLPDPRRVQGRRHPLSVVLAIAAAAHLCGVRGYKHIAEWAENLSQSARQRFGCRCVARRYLVPSESIIRDVLIRVDPQHLDRALRGWNAQFSPEDASLAIDGKTMCNATDDSGAQTHIMSVIGHDSGACYTQKKSAACP